MWVVALPHDSCSKTTGSAQPCRPRPPSSYSNRAVNVLDLGKANIQRRMALSANRAASLTRPLSADGRAERAARQADADARAETRGAFRTGCADLDLIAGNADLGAGDIENTGATDKTTSGGAQGT